MHNFRHHHTVRSDTIHFSFFHTGHQPLIFFRVHVSLVHPRRCLSSTDTSSQHRFSNLSSYSLSITYSLRSLVSFFDFTLHYCYPQLPTSLVFHFSTTAYFYHPESSPQHIPQLVRSQVSLRDELLFLDVIRCKPIQEMRNFLSFHAMRS